MDQYRVTGMSCAACAARIEKAVSAVPGVASCAVSLLTNSMGVEGNADPAAVVAAVEKAGYGAEAPAGAASAAVPTADALKDRETPVLIRRLAVSAALLFGLMYVSMGHVMFGFPVPMALHGDPAALALLQAVLAAAIMLVNQRFFVSGAKSLLRRAPNMDTLVAMGSGVSWAWSLFVLFRITHAMAAGDMETAHAFLHQLYFESAGMILTLITVGKLLEARAKGKTTDAIKGLMALSPPEATVLRGEKEERIPASAVRTGDIFLVRPGESVPADGAVIEGISAVNESSLTGESLPVDKKEGAKVWAGTVNQSGLLRCRAEQVGGDTALAKIIKTVTDAAATKAPIAKTADKISAVFVPAVLGVSVLTLTVWLLCRAPFVEALEHAIAVLVISCPCALGLATPVAVTVGSGLGAKHGILFKTAQSLEQAGKAGVIVLDKTGTVTEGDPAVTDVLPADGVTADRLLAAAAAAESKSEHPLAKAVTAYAAAQGVAVPEAADFEALSGAGLRATLDGKPFYGGNLKLISARATVPEKIGEAAAALAKEGKTPLFFALDGSLLGVIAVADPIKPESPEAIRQLRAQGMRVIMLTGDQQATAEAVGRQAGVDEVIAGVRPEEKYEVVRRLQAVSPVLMVGDGINDAPALTAADTGVAIGAGTDVAVDAADVVLMKSRLTDVPAAVRLSRRTLRNIRQNLFWAFFYNVLGIPLAAGVWIPLFGWELSPMFGAAAMSLSSFFVVSNALRLNLFDPHSAKRDKKIKRPAAFEIELKEKEKGEKNMITTVAKIEGMMCPRCEAHVKEAIEKNFDVQSVTASHEKNEAVVVSAAPLDAQKLADVVGAAGYQFVGIE